MDMEKNIKNLHELIFEGNYLKGKKYGKSIEYYENVLKK